VFFKTFGWSFVFTFAALTAGFFYGGWTAVASIAILSVLEVSLSFDNAVVNAKVLEKMNAFWQRMFLTVGFVIAVVGVRLVFPVLLVSATAGITPDKVVTLALAKGAADEPGSYGYLLQAAHPAIASFGGIFLLMVFFHFIFAEKEISWLRWLEEPLARIGRLESVPVIAGVLSLIGAAITAAPHDQTAVLFAGLAGLVTFLAVNGLGNFFESTEDDVIGNAGKAGHALFLYINVLDASFSFDGVLGAFAITPDPLLIMLGLGVGAIFVRSLTVLMVRKKTLGTYVFLEHGAHWAIGALAVILMMSITVEVSEIVTGCVGLVFIAAALAASVARNRRNVDA
jgi:hypothetical protein